MIYHQQQTKLLLSFKAAGMKCVCNTTTCTLFCHCASEVFIKITLIGVLNFITKDFRIVGVSVEHFPPVLLFTGY